MCRGWQGLTRNPRCLLLRAGVCFLDDEASGDIVKELQEDLLGGKFVNSKKIRVILDAGPASDICYISVGQVP